MKADWSHLEAYRKQGGTQWHTPAGAHDGVFYIPHANNTQIICIASSGCDEVPWEHVSLRVAGYKGDRCPTWQEMCRVKDMFWSDEECVVQYHPPKSDYVNNHPAVLHLWKPLNVEMPRPPSIAVGIK